LLNHAYINNNTLNKYIIYTKQIRLGFFLENLRTNLSFKNCVMPHMHRC